MSENIEEVVKSMKEVDFKMGKTTLSFKDNLKMVSTVKFEKTDGSGHAVVFAFDNEGKISWQMGNYSGHLCSAESDIILDLVSKNLNVKSILVNRDISNETPLQMEETLEGGK